ncbi:MAG: DUF1214 domain-containing protein [Candidatus Binatia bacterium]
MSERQRDERATDAARALGSGTAWVAFCDELQAAGADLLRPTAPNAPVDLAEGARFLTRMLRCAFEHIMESGDPAAPAFFHVFTETMKSGWDNPDNIHTNAFIDGALDYRIAGTRGEAHYMSIGVYGGSLGREGGRRTVAYVDVDTLTIGPDGTFEIILSQRQHPGNWIRLEPDASTIMVRETFWERPREVPAKLRVERLDAAVAPPSPSFVVSALRRSLRFVRGSNRIFFDIADRWRARPNTFFPSDPRQAAATIGIPNMFYASGWWEMTADQAIVLDVTPPPCRYWSLTLGNYWGESLDYRYRRIHVNARNASYRPDNSVRIILAASDPRLPHTVWLDTSGRDSGVWTLRWLEATTHPLPQVRVVARADVAAL